MKLEPALLAAAVVAVVMIITGATLQWGLPVGLLATGGVILVVVPMFLLPQNL